jgi:hypothetical protein
LWHNRLSEMPTKRSIDCVTKIVEGMLIRKARRGEEIPPDDIDTYQMLVRAAEITQDGSENRPKNPEGTGGVREMEKRI